MIVETTAIPDSPKRMFYGISNNGEPFFGNQQYHATIVISGQTKSNNTRYEGEIFVVTINNKEYLFSIGKGDNKYAELYDLSSLETKSQVLSNTFLGATKMISIRGSSTNFIKDEINYILFSFIDNSSFSLKLLYFSSTDIKNTDPIINSYSLNVDYGKSVSCFITDSYYIICIFLNKEIAFWSYIYIGIYKSDLSGKIIEINTNYLQVDYSSDFEYFLKCIHLEKEVGVFIFYKQTKLKMDSYPIILFKYYNDKSSSLNDYFSSNSVISLNKKSFNSYTLLNDIIKISNSKLCFISTSTDKDELYIVLLNIFNSNQIIIRYYQIEIYELYNFKFLLEMAVHPYNNYIAFAFCFCRQSQCKSKTDPHYAGMMIFSYANGTDYNLNLTDYLFNNNEIKIYDLQIDLKENVRIDNNVFGHVYSGIEIKQIINCDNINLYSSLYENTYISINYTLIKNEKINVTFNSYNDIICLIKYIYIITEPNFEEYNTYVNRIDTGYGEDTASIFNNAKNKYKSRVLDYYISIDKKLENKCTDINCELCLENEKNYCITCKYNYTIYDDGNIKKKTCYPNKDIGKTTEIKIDTTQIIKTSEIKIDITQIIKTSVINIDTTQNIKTSETKIDQTQIIKSSVNNIDTTQIIKSSVNNIDSNQSIKSSIINIDTTQLIKNSIINIDTTQLIKSSVINIDTTQSIKSSEIQNTEMKTIPIIKSNKISTLIDNTKKIQATELQVDTTQFVETTQLKVDINKETEISDNTEKSKNESSKSCTNEEIISNVCENGKMSNSQVGEIYNTIKNNILTKDYNGENKVIQTENVIFQVSTLEDQKNSNNPNVSSIDLGECENILKNKYNISNEDSLIVVKTDIKSSDLSSTYVQYEVYNPYSLKQLNLDDCKDIKIVVSVPVNLNDETLSLYNSLSDSGYNLFDSEDDFYNDVCSTYTSGNGTDMTLEDRKKEIYSTTENLTMCQSGCEFELYNTTTKKAKCNCDVQTNTTETDVTKINFSKENILNSFVDTLTNSNFLVLKCYKLVLSLQNILKNKGRIIMTILYILFIISLLAYIIKDRKRIHIFINMILKNKENIFKLPKNQKTQKIEKVNVKSKSNEKKIKEKKVNEKKTKENKNKNNKKDLNKKLIKNNKKKEKSPLKNKKKINKKSAPPKKRRNSISKKVTQLYNNSNTKSYLKSPEKQSKININIIPIKNIHFGKLKNKNKLSKKITNYQTLQKTENNKFENNNKKFKYLDSKSLNDQELNTLEYNIAISIDKRTYLQYYWSLLKKKQLILFTILPANDYNLLTLKISLFLLSFSLYFTINGFFFSDDTMHKIHEDNGSYNIIYQIPQILYSSVVSAVINMVLKMLSLSEKNILAIKQENDIKIAIRKSKGIEMCITIKFIIFFIFSNILLLFFWYFISCFCAVYINTQMILIKDTLVSFGLSMIYPFGLNLLPGIFRIPALRAKEKDKKCLYQISGLVALI